MAVSRLASGTSLLAANMSEMLLPFARNAALAHLLSTQQMGLAISLTVVASSAELVTDIGMNYTAVRTNSELPPDRVYATLHAVLLLRAAIIGLGIVVVSPFLVIAFDSRDALWAYMLIGLASLIRGFTNLGTKEKMRQYSFWPEAATIIGAQIAWTVGSIALAWWTHDFSCMIWGILGSAATGVLLSHLLSDRRWRVAWERSVAREAFRYGRPLIPNGMANAMNVMGDRFIVGSFLGVSSLALYNVAMTMAVLPRGALLKVLNNFFMPVFVNQGAEKARQNRIYDLWAMCLATIGLASGIGLISIGRPMVGIVFGSVYQPSPLLMSLISINICIKFLVGLPVPPSLAYGQTRFVLWGSVATCLAVVFAGVLLPRLPSIEGFVFALTLGEFLALLWITRRAITIHGFTPGLTWFAVLFPTAILSGLALLRAELPDLPLSSWIAISWTAGAVGLAVVVAVPAWQGVDVMRLVRTRTAVREFRPDAAPAE